MVVVCRPGFWGFWVAAEAGWSLEDLDCVGVGVSLLLLLLGSGVVVVAVVVVANSVFPGQETVFHSPEPELASVFHIGHDGELGGVGDWGVEDVLWYAGWVGMLVVFAVLVVLVVAVEVEEDRVVFCCGRVVVWGATFFPLFFAVVAA